MKINPLIIVQHYGRDILESPGMEMSKGFMQHGDTSVFAHSLEVALICVQIAYFLPRFLSKRLNKRALVRGALLHDYFLYDWHASGHNLHGFFHPGRALKNADRDFSLTSIERNMIKTHMFPLTLPPPKFKESWILAVADKICAVKETFGK